MGQRANLVVIRDGQWQLYYDHWCANRLDRELFWGPELATEFAQARGPVDRVSGWLDDVWCEGGAVIDHDRHVLVWFGGEDLMGDPVRRAVHAQAMAHVWEGWEIRWARGGIVDLATYVGAPTEDLRTGRGTDSEYRGLSVDIEDPKYNDVAASIVDVSGLRALRLSGEIEDVEFGLGQLSRLLEYPRSEDVRFDDLPQFGVHLEVESRRLSLWAGNNTEADFVHLAAAWPGWEIVDLDDDFAQHLALAGGKLRWPGPDRAKAWGELLSGLRTSHWKPNNPALNIAARRGGTVSAATHEARGSVGDPDTKRALVDRLEREFTPV